MNKLTKTEYNTIHQYMLRHYSKVGVCVSCKQEKKTEWASVDGLYDRNDITKWQELCRQCHIAYDRLILKVEFGRNNTSGTKGVAKHRKGWIAYRDENGKRQHIGKFKTKEEAILVHQQFIDSLKVQSYH
jgi:protein-arginine kinase activator protein McsA